MSRILVDLGWLEDVHGNVADTISALDGADNRVVRTPSEHVLDHRLGSFFGRWDDRAGQLSEALSSVAQLIVAIHDSFEEADVQLGDAVND